MRLSTIFSSIPLIFSNNTKYHGLLYRNSGVLYLCSVLENQTPLTMSNLIHKVKDVVTGHHHSECNEATQNSKSPSLTNKSNGDCFPLLPTSETTAHIIQLPATRAVLQGLTLMPPSVMESITTLQRPARRNSG